MNRENLEAISRGLTKLFDEMNAYLYDADLQRPTFKYSNKMSAQKWRCEKEIKNGEVTYTYVVPFSQVKKEKVIYCLLRAMCDQYFESHEIPYYKDHYYYRLYGRFAKKHGMTCKNKSNVPTGIQDEVEEYIHRKELQYDFSSLLPCKKRYTVKYTCPICGQVARTYGEGSLVCGHCGTYMISQRDYYFKIL